MCSMQHLGRLELYVWYIIVGDLRSEFQEGSGVNAEGDEYKLR